MTRAQIARRRLASQHLVRPTLRTAEGVVQWLGAVQAQDYAGAKWAVGQRMRAATDADVERAFEAGEIIRTHATLADFTMWAVPPTALSAHIITIDGRIVAGWKRTFQGRTVGVVVNAIVPLTPAHRRAIENEIQRYGAFLAQQPATSFSGTC